MIYCKEYANKGLWEIKNEDEQENTVKSYKHLIYVELFSDEAIDETVDKKTIVNFPQEYALESVFICPGSICWDTSSSTLYMSNSEEKFIQQ